MIEPFDKSGVKRGPDGIARYDNLAGSLVEMLGLTVARYPKGEAIVEIGGERIDYTSLWERAARVAGGLHAMNIGRGDRVAIQLGNGLDWCLAFFGIQLSGAIAVPVNTRFAPPEVEYVLGDSGSSYSFRPGESLLDGPPFVAEGIDAEDVSAIFYTSGTTGFPKGAMTTHANFLTNVENCHRIGPLSKDDRIRTLVSVPLFHVTGCNSQLLFATSCGGTTVILPAFTVQGFLDAIVAERTDSVTSVPAIHWLAINQPQFKDLDVSHVRFVFYGGAPIAPELVLRLMAAYPKARVGNGFGLTETSSVSTFLPHEYSSTNADSVGFPAPVVDLDLLEPDAETGVGELLVRGPNIVKGYWNKPEATQAAFVNGWLHTGDMARISDEGFVYIVDRKKDMINRGGENVYCVEVENALAAHPSVFEVAVIGVADLVMGEKVGAVIVTRPGAEVTAAEILAFARENLADFKVPQYLILRSDPLPRNPGGKIVKPVLRKTVEWGTPIR
ncbi:MAG: AMP-binding protein [Acidobacteriota bacterium]